MEFESIWLETDAFKYFVNNLRKKGNGSSPLEKEELNIPVSIVATVEKSSRYVLRSDIAYDWNIKVHELSEYLNNTAEHSLYPFARRIDRYGFVKHRDQATWEDSPFGKTTFDNIIRVREQYIDGLQIKFTYTALAQFWHIRNALKYKKLRIVSDKDNALISAIMRAFYDEIDNGCVHTFTCTIDKTLSKKEAYVGYLEGQDTVNIYKNAMSCDYYDALISIMKMRMKAKNAMYRIKNGLLDVGSGIEYPAPYKDEGRRIVTPRTDLTSLDEDHIAAMLCKVDNRAINTFFNQIRRRISILERPLVGARSGGKSYIYSNVNPKYAHYLVTILRTYLNYCIPIRYGKNEDKMTPAMKIGIAKKIYTIKDILYIK